jgi:hypothetical protein
LGSVGKVRVEEGTLGCKRRRQETQKQVSTCQHRRGQSSRKGPNGLSCRRVGEDCFTGDSSARVVDERLLEEVEAGFVETRTSVREVLRVPLRERGLVVWEGLDAGPDVVVGRSEKTAKVGQTERTEEG